MDGFCVRHGVPYDPVDGCWRCECDARDREDEKRRATSDADARIAALEAENARLRGAAMCDACAGSGTPISGRPCMCGGSGHAADAVIHLRGALAAEEVRADRLRAMVPSEEEREAIRALEAGADTIVPLVDAVKSANVARVYLRRLTAAKEADRG